MKNSAKSLFIISLLILLGNQLFAQDLTAREIVKTCDDKMQGETNTSTMTMTLVRPSWTRTIQMENWAYGRDYSMTLITAPAKEKGQSFLKRMNDMWSWQPKISRVVKLSSSMMSQGWMGSDYTNDDILKESSIVNDYNHSIQRTEQMAGRDCYVIDFKPKEEAVVVWGRIEMWISKKDFLQLKAKYYDEDNYLVRTINLSEIKEMDGRLIPTKLEIIPEEEENQKTILEINSIDFNIDIKPEWFTQQRMKRLQTVRK